MRISGELVGKKVCTCEIHFVCSFNFIMWKQFLCFCMVFICISTTVVTSLFIIIIVCRIVD